MSLCPSQPIKMVKIANLDNEPHLTNRKHIVTSSCDRSKAVVLLLLIHFCCCFYCYAGVVFGSYFVVQY